MSNPPTPLRLFNGLTRSLETFTSIEPGVAKVYSCGPTVYSYQHIGNMRAYVFTDTLGRILSYKGYGLRHVINITDVGHLTSDADTGEDKMEQAAAKTRMSAPSVARFYTDAFWRDVELLNIRSPSKWAFATDHIPQMLAFAERIAGKHCYQLDTGLYFDVATVPDYGRLARAETREGDARIEMVECKRHPADFAIWRTSKPGEQRQMEWDSPWGKGAPGWHLECSTMSKHYLGDRFDIHTGGIDHREIHHPNEIAQNQAFDDSAHPGATIWLHNNFLVNRSGKMSKSAGEALILQRLVDRGFHPLAFRLLCLSAHYRSELEFSWDALQAALTRLKRIVAAIHDLKLASPDVASRSLELESVVQRFDEMVSEDLMIPRTLPLLDEVLAADASPEAKLHVLNEFDQVLGLKLLTLTRADLRVRRANAALTVEQVEEKLAHRKVARDERNFALADSLRAELMAASVEVMDGDPLGWDWMPNTD
nr:cysteine--tRNA ligase [uncultured Albidiferax sp.]